MKLNARGGATGTKKAVIAAYSPADTRRSDIWLGAGGTIEGATLVLQGDHRLKLPDLLLRRGVKRVSQGTLDS